MGLPASVLPASFSALSVSVLALALGFASTLAASAARCFLARCAALAVSVLAFLGLSGNFLTASLCRHAESLACLLRGSDLGASQLRDKTFLESRLHAA